MDGINTEGGDCHVAGKLQLFLKVLWQLPVCCSGQDACWCFLCCGNLLSSSHIGHGVLGGFRDDLQDLVMAFNYCSR